MEKLYCTTCCCKVSYDESKKSKEYDYKGFVIPVEDNVKTCAICGEELYDEENEERIFQEIYGKYLEQFDLSFDKFRAIREKFGLSQDLFAKLMNWSKKTIIRYENRQTLPQKEYLEKYMELDNNPNKIYELLSFSKNYLKPDDYQKIIRSLEKSGNYNHKFEKLKNTVLYILHNGELYTTQLLKHLFAADFAYHKDNNTSITGYKYAKLPYGPVLDNYREILNNLIESGAVTTIIDDLEPGVDSIKFKATQHFDKSLFIQSEIEVLDTIMNSFKGRSSKNLSDWSHDFVGWQKTSNGKLIDYKYSKDLNM